MLRLLAMSCVLVLPLGVLADSIDTVLVYRAVLSPTSTSQDVVELNGQRYAIADSPIIDTGDIVCIERVTGSEKPVAITVRISEEASHSLDKEYSVDARAYFVVFVNGKPNNSFVLRGLGVARLSFFGHSNGDFEVCGNDT